MTRSELVERLQARIPTLTIDDSKTIIGVILEAITGSLVRDERAEIRGFGSFSLTYRQPRLGRNPKTGERVQIPGKYAPYFKPGKDMRDRVDF